MTSTVKQERMKKAFRCLATAQYKAPKGSGLRAAINGRMWQLVLRFGPEVALGAPNRRGVVVYRHD